MSSNVKDRHQAVIDKVVRSWQLDMLGVYRREMNQSVMKIIETGNYPVLPLFAQAGVQMVSSNMNGYAGYDEELLEKTDRLFKDVIDHAGKVVHIWQMSNGAMDYTIHTPLLDKEEWTITDLAEMECVVGGMSADEVSVKHGIILSPYAPGITEEMLTDLQLLLVMNGKNKIVDAGRYHAVTRILKYYQIQVVNALNGRTVTGLTDLIDSWRDHYDSMAIGLEYRSDTRTLTVAVCKSDERHPTYEEMASKITADTTPENPFSLKKQDV